MSIKFFIDENLSKALADGMKGFGEEVIHLTDIFPSGTTDTEWMEYVWNNEMILVTRDEMIRRHPAEMNALIDFKVGAFFLGGKKLKRCQIIQQVVRNWPHMKELASKSRKPFAYRVPPKGNKFSQISL